MTALAPSLVATSPIGSVSQRAASPDTIAAYALAFRLLLAFAAGRTGSPRPRTRGHPTVASPSAHPAESSEVAPSWEEGSKTAVGPNIRECFAAAWASVPLASRELATSAELVDYCRRC